MGSVPGVTEAAASLLETDPSLAHALGPRSASEIGREPILPVLTVPAGPWEPPARDAFAGEIVAMVVLEGLLAVGTPGHLIGPGDMIRPWGVTWTVSTPARLALIGTRFVDALQAWPGVAGKALERAAGSAPAIPSAGAVDERVLEVLWRVAGRSGVPRRNGVSLPAALDAGALARLLRVSERRVEGAVALLSARGILVRGDGSGWLLPMAPAGPRSGHSRQRRDDLRARQAHQMALARTIQSEHAELSAQSQAEIALSHRRRGV